MRIMCSIIRAGGTIVSLRDTTYHFKPEDDGRHIADVDEADIKTFLNIPESYALADEADMANLPVEPVDEPDISATLVANPFPPVGDQDVPVPPVQDTGDEDQPYSELALEEMDEAQLSAVYQEVFDKPPHHAAKPSSIIAKILEAQALTDEGE